MEAYQPPFEITNEILNLVHMTIPEKPNSRNQRYVKG